MSDLREIIVLIEIHHKNNPDHGLDCACMDHFIRQLREMFKATSSDCQSRVDYVLRSAVDR